MKANLTPASILPLLIAGGLWACSSSNSSQVSQGGASGQGGSAAQGGAQAGGQGGAQGGTSPQGGASSGGAGSSGEGGQPGYDPTSLCPQACAALLACNDAFDAPACEAQCTKELTGTGFLIPEMANDYFSFIRDAPSSTYQCSFLNTDFLWTKTWSAGIATLAKYDSLKEQELIAQCTAVQVKCDGETQQIVHKSHCVLYYYIYNTPTRDEIKNCLAGKCIDLQYCIGNNQLSTRPWLAGGPPK